MRLAGAGEPLAIDLASVAPIPIAEHVVGGLRPQAEAALIEFVGIGTTFTSRSRRRDHR